MDNDNQLPPMGPTPMDGMSSGQPISGGLAQNEVSRILMSQGSMPGGAMPQPMMPQATMPQDMGPQGPMSQGPIPPAGPMGGPVPQEGPMGGPMSQEGPMGGPMPQEGPMGGPMSQGPGMPPQGMMTQSLGPDGRPMMQQPMSKAQLPVPKKKDVGGLVKTIVIIALSLLAITFIGLFIWMNGQYEEEKEKSADVEGKVNEAVAVARDEVTTKMEADFLNREKYPYAVFSGPEDYGGLTFEYPKTWSVYIAAAADDGGDFNAYFNPVQVDAVGKETINALRVTIRNKSFEEVTAEYQKAMEKKNSDLTMETVTVFNSPANRYTGTIPGTELKGYIVIFKIRDKTVVLQTDSVLFEADFNKLLETVTFSA